MFKKLGVLRRGDEERYFFALTPMSEKNLPQLAQMFTDGLERVFLTDVQMNKWGWRAGVFKTVRNKSGIRADARGF